MTEFVIAIDGPAAAGKTTVGSQVAQRLGWTFLDTGVLYRALAWEAIQRGIAADDEAGLEGLATELRVTVSRPSCPDGRLADVMLNEIDVTWDIRAPAVDLVVSTVAAMPGVRAALIPVQRGVAAHQPAVVVGRDIGTIIFPDAALKIYLDAGIAERARRRVQDLRARGEAITPDEVAEDLRRRDRLDSARANAPLSVAPDAILLDTDGQPVQAVVDTIVALARSRGVGQS